jgi:hypothetical protein
MAHPTAKITKLIRVTTPAWAVAKQDRTKSAIRKKNRERVDAAGREDVRAVDSLRPAMDIGLRASATWTRASLCVDVEFVKDSAGSAEPLNESMSRAGVDDNGSSHCGVISAEEGGGGEESAGLSGSDCETIGSCQDSEAGVSSRIS